MSNPIKNSHKHIQEIAELKKQRADPETIKGKAERLAQMNSTQWKKYQQQLEKAKLNESAEKVTDKIKKKREAGSLNATAAKAEKPPVSSKNKKHDEQ